MDYFVNALQEHPELAIFLTLALGFLVGRVKIGSFSFGTVVGTLLVGVLVGQLHIKVPDIVKTNLFRSLSFYDRLQSRTSVFPRVEKRCSASSCGYRRIMRHLFALRFHGIQTPWI